MTYNHGLYLATAGIALTVGCGGAYAQQATTSQTATQPSSQLQEIVITAEKRTEKLSDATVAATVLNEEALKTANVSDISDVNKLVPSVNLNGTFNGRVPLAIRGVQSDSNEAAVGVASGVGIEVDGVPIPSDSFAGNDFEDVDAVEVLKGPQATLGGRTATSGVIQIRTHEPSDQWTGSLSGTVTDDDEHHVQGYIAGPVTDKFLVSLVGWGHYLVYPNTNIHDGGDRHSYSDSYGFRDKLLFKPTDDLDIKLSTRLSAFQSYGANLSYAYITPGAHILGVPVPFLTPAALMPGVEVNSHNTLYDSINPNGSERHYDWDATLDIDYRFGDYTLSSTTAYQRENRRDVQDLFVVGAYFLNELAGAPLFPNQQTVWTDTSQWSQEVKLASPLDQPINFVAGVFYSDTTVDEYYYRFYLSSASQIVSVSPDTSTVAAYGRVNAKVAQDTTVAVGARYNWDMLSYTAAQYTYNGVYRHPAGSGLPQADPFPPFDPILGSDSNDSTAFVGDVSVKQQLTPDWMVYAKYSRGYAPSVFNTAATMTVANPHLDLVGQETIDSWELGTKGRFLDNTLEIDADLFDTDYQNYQIQTYLNTGSFSPPLVTTAAGEAETMGFEMSSAWKPFSGTTLNFAGAYTYAVFRKFENGPCYWGGTPSAAYIPPGCYFNASADQYQANLTGKTMPNAPRFTFRTGGEQRIPTGSLPISLSVGADVYFRSGAMMVPDQNPYARQAAFATLNLHATIADESGEYALTLFANNVTDTHYNVDVEDYWSGVWQSNAVVVQPARDTNQYFGARFTAQF